MSEKGKPPPPARRRTASREVPAAREPIDPTAGPRPSGPAVRRTSTSGQVPATRRPTSGQIPAARPPLARRTSSREVPRAPGFDREPDDRPTGVSAFPVPPGAEPSETTDQLPDLSALERSGRLAPPDPDGGEGPATRMLERPAGFGAPEHEAEGETMMLAEGPATRMLERPASFGEPEPTDRATLPDDGATRMLERPASFGDPSADAETLPPASAASTKPMARASAGLYSRRMSGEMRQADPLPSAAPAQAEIPPMPPEVKRRLAMAGGLLVGLLLASASWSFYVSATRPSLDELYLLYPYGVLGRQEETGRILPGALELEFEYEGTAPCRKGSADDCLLYRYAKEDDSFSGTMRVRPNATGWERVDERLGN